LAFVWGGRREAGGLDESLRVLAKRKKAMSAKGSDCSRRGGGRVEPQGGVTAALPKKRGGARVSLRRDRQQNKEKKKKRELREAGENSIRIRRGQEVLTWE